MKHLDSGQLSAHLDGRLAGRARAEAEQHLASCEACRVALAELGAQEAALKPALTHDPGDAYFATFSARVEDRIRAAGLKGAQSRLGQARGPSLAEWLVSPRRLAIVGAAAAVIAGAGIVLLTTREVPPGFRDPALEGRLSQESGARVESPSALRAPKRETDQIAARSNEAAGPKAAGESHREGRGADHDASSPSAPPPALEKAQNTRAEPQRAYEVRRDARSGEDVRVVRPGGSQFAQPPAPSAQDEEGSKVRKRAPAPLRGGRSGEVEYNVTPGVVPEPEEASGLASDAAPAPSLGPASLLQGEGGTARLCGDARDPAGRPVGGVQVTIADLGRSVTTDEGGRFCIEAPPGDHTLTAMAPGFETARQQVVVGRGSSTVRLTLKPVPELGAVRDAPAFSYYDPLPEDDLPANVRPIVQRAQADLVRAERQRSAKLFESAAGLWERAAGLLGDDRDLGVRFRLAHARYRAWLAAPNPRRGLAAEQALETFLTRTPAGAERDSASRWLDQVKR